jgi:hypothetical protein
MIRTEGPRLGKVGTDFPSRQMRNRVCAEIILKQRNQKMIVTVIVTVACPRKI